MPSTTDSFFDRSDYNRGALTRGAICAGNQVQIASWIAAGLKRPLALADICCGSGWAAVRVLRHFRSIERVCCIDRSLHQLHLARGLVGRALAGRAMDVSFVAADARQLPLRSGTFDVMTWACAIHLFSLDEAARVAHAAWESLRPGGVLAVITFDLADIGQSLCDQFVAGYADTDRGRYHALGPLAQALALDGRFRVSPRRAAGVQHFSGVREVERLLRQRSFSTFQLMQDALGRDELDARIESAVLRLRDRFARGRIAVPQQALLLLCERRP